MSKISAEKYEKLAFLMLMPSIYATCCSKFKIIRALGQVMAIIFLPWAVCVIIFLLAVAFVVMVITKVAEWWANV